MYRDFLLRILGKKSQMKNKHFLLSMQVISASIYISSKKFFSEN